MGSIATKSPPVAPRQTVQEAIRELAEQLPSNRRSPFLKRARVLEELPASQTRRVLDIIRQRAGDGRLDYNWVSSFIAVLRRLKSEEDHSFSG
ncbi:MAG: hypothetical protein JSW23_07555 [Planctomycetota bacterium]|nr:MAG: hypothetical protein JSW23_07555 [Planctomycetota bacterium]